MLAENIEQAISFYAHESGHTKGDCCPVCEEISCTVHLDPSEWDDPLEHLQEYSWEPKQWSGVPVDRQPTAVEWLRAGFSVPCEECHSGEPDECVERNGRALCWDCVHALEPELGDNQ